MGTEGIGAVFSSEAARDFLFDLGHTNGLFGDIVGEWDIVVGGEAPGIVGVVAQSEQEVRRLALSRSAALAGFRGERIDGFTVGEELFITRGSLRFVVREEEHPVRSPRDRPSPAGRSCGRPRLVRVPRTRRAVRADDGYCTARVCRAIHDRAANRHG